MSESKKQPGFQPGHPRYSGRGKNTVAHARALAEELGVCPLTFLLEIVRGDAITKTVIDNGKKRKVPVVVPLEMRIDAAKHVSRFLFPTLSAAQVQTQAQVETTVDIGFNVAAVLADPALAKAAQDLALKLAASGLKGELPAPDPNSPHYSS